MEATLDIYYSEGIIINHHSFNAEDIESTFAIQISLRISTKCFI